MTDINDEYNETIWTFLAKNNCGKTKKGIWNCYIKVMYSSEFQNTENNQLKKTT